MAEERCWGECGGARPAETPQGLCKECLSKLQRQSSAKAGQDGIPTSTTPPAGFVPPGPAELAGQFPQLEIIELLGQGGMGAVYKARQKHLDRLVALKILPSQIGLTQAFADRFVREARSLAKLNDPHIVSVFDFGRTETGLFYFIMEFVDGTDLRRVIQTGELPAAEALEIISQICDALQYAHDEGVVHRDVKPENILLNKKGQAKIADFGLAKLVGRSTTGYTLTHAGQRMGTPHYMAPEQIERPNEVDHRADIYSLGVVFYEMLTGELPLGLFPPPSQKAAVDTRLDAVILRTLEKEPDRRYQHVSEIKTEMETISSGDRIDTSHIDIADEDFEAARQRLGAPAAGLKVAGLMNCFTGLILLLAWMILAMSSGVTSAGTTITGAIGLIVGTVGLLTIVATQRMVRLQSYGLAVAAAVLQFVAFPGSLIGIWMGIWALIVLTKNKVHTAFIRAMERQEPVEESAFWKKAINIAAVAGSVIFLITFLGSFGSRHFPWFVFLFGPPVLILDIFALQQWKQQTGLSYKWLWERVRIELEKLFSKAKRRLKKKGK
ncbi:MAG: protein kinase [Sedimentisphaerales bacterium]|nr:protein kinase [Sedimentisphaerales bacterium]